ncbi:uncharacterized protein M6B38_367210 [Iris pallida]|uniref:Senescence regulator n=1 Tax=Iris pallida TaxID=29817 RepID=A0AAX6GG34_IRIPA|nr:uncharacterized protein M6B38_367210 [Iris pallida]
MAKGGRKHATSDRRDRLLGTTYGYDHGGRSVGPEFGEEDVWPAADEPLRAVRTARSGRRSGQVDDEDDGVRRQLGGLSLAFENIGDGGVVHRRHETRHVAAASAPVDVPADWSRMGRAGPDDPVDGSAGETEWVPPHEYLAREHGRSVTTSVFVGVGRTLKGRDMSRVRDAVWSQTGFFG